MLCRFILLVYKVLECFEKNLVEFVKKIGFFVKKTLESWGKS